MAVTTTRINFPAPNPESGTVSCYYEYQYTGDTQGGVHVYEQYRKINESGFSQSVQSPNLNSLGITDGARIISVMPHATIPANHRIVLGGSIFMSAPNIGQIKDYLNKFTSFNRTLSLTYSASAPTPPWEITMPTVTEKVSQTFTSSYYFTACSLDVIWVPAGEEIPEAEDPIHENTDSNALFVINPYGPVKESCGVGIGGWPVGDSANNPTMDCFIKTVFKKPLTIANNSVITQNPVWKDTYGMLKNDYTYRMVDNEIYGPPQFCQVNGTVYLRGYVTRAGVSNNTLIFTLPEGYRPSKELQKTCYYQRTNSQGDKGFAIIKIGTDGNVTFVLCRSWGTAGNALNTSTGFINLDLSFRLPHKEA